MKLKALVTKAAYLLRGQRSHMVSVNLCGSQLKVLKNSFRLKEDQDDAWWYHLAQHHEVIYDIGCNVGYTALLALIQRPERPMLLVDPNPMALQNAAINLIANGLSSQVYFKNAFVSEKVDEIVKFYTIGTGAAGSMHASHAQSAASINAFIDVNTVTLDYLYSQYKLKPDLVKIDVEGAEVFVMQGAKSMAKATACAFFVEMHNVEGLGMEAAAQMILDWCDEMNYKAWYLKTGEVLNTAETIKHRGKCHLLLQPNHKTYPEYLKGIEQSAALPKT